MDWKRLGYRMGAVALVWMAISFAAIYSSFIHPVEANPLLFLIYWLVMAGSMIYVIAKVIWPVFRFILENARSKPR